MVPRVARIRAAKAFPHQLRQEPAVIDMGMRQQHGIDIGGPKWKGAVIQLLQRLWTLKQAAVDEKRRPRFEQVAGAGHGAGRAAKSNGDAHDVFSGHCRHEFAAQGDAKFVECDRVGRMRHAVGRADGADAGVGEIAASSGGNSA